MNRRWSHRDRRAIRVGVALALPLSVALFVGRPLHRLHAGLREDLASETELLGRELALLAARDDLKTALLARLRILREAEGLTFDDAGSLAGSALARTVASAADASGLEVRSAESRGTSDDQRLSHAELDVVMVGEWTAVLRFLGRIRSEEKATSVVSFSLSRVGGGGEGDGAALQLEARVAGLLAPPTPETHPHRSLPE